MMKNITLILGIFAIAFVANSAAEKLQSRQQGWNQLLNGNGLFSEPLNTIQVKSTEDDDVAMLEQFKNILSQDNVMETVYNKYRMAYKVPSDPGDYVEFKEQLIRIATHNIETQKGQQSWWMGVNQFTDMTAAELRRQTFGVKNLENVTTPYVSTSGVAAPASLNYVEQQRVSSVKNQGVCDIGQIFAAVAIVDSAHARKNKKNHCLSHSVQEILDCSSAGFCCEPGCNPSAGTRAALQRAKDYALTWWKLCPMKDPIAKGSCGYAGARRKVQVKDILESNISSEEELKTMLSDQGPLVINIHASDALKKNYGKGVYAGTECGSSPTNHAVALVGYGTEGGQDYWLIKNSLGQNWGEQGFLKLLRNGDNVCGIYGPTFGVTVK